MNLSMIVKGKMVQMSPLAH